MIGEQKFRSFIYARNESETLFASEKLPSTAVISMFEHTRGQ